MDGFTYWSPYVSLATFIFLMFVGSAVQFPQLMAFSAGAAFPLGLHCLKREEERRQ